MRYKTVAVGIRRVLIPDLPDEDIICQRLRPATFGDLEINTLGPKAVSRLQ